MSLSFASFISRFASLSPGWRSIATSRSCTFPIASLIVLICSSIAAVILKNCHYFWSKEKNWPVVKASERGNVKCCEIKKHAWTNNWQPPALLPCTSLTTSADATLSRTYYRIQLHSCCEEKEKLRVKLGKYHRLKRESWRIIPIHWNLMRNFNDCSLIQQVIWRFWSEYVTVFTTIFQHSIPKRHDPYEWAYNKLFMGYSNDLAHSLKRETDSQAFREKAFLWAPGVFGVSKELETLSIMYICIRCSQKQQSSDHSRRLFDIIAIKGTITTAGASLEK